MITYSSANLASNSDPGVVSRPLLCSALPCRLNCMDASVPRQAICLLAAGSSPAGLHAVIKRKAALLGHQSPLYRLVCSYSTSSPAWPDRPTPPKKKPDVVGGSLPFPGPRKGSGQMPFAARGAETPTRRPFGVLLRGPRYCHSHLVC